MADMARGLARKKIAALAEALAGRLDEHHRLILAIQLARVEQAEREIALLGASLTRLAAPHDAEIAILTSIPGIEQVSAIAILAEIGPDMAVFPTAGHLAAWAGVCPGNNQSGGNHRPAKARTGNRHLKTTLCNAAIGASRKKASFFRAKYYSLKARIGGGKAALAIGHKLLVCAWTMLSQGCLFKDLGQGQQTGPTKEQVVKRYASKLRALGYDVVPHPAPGAA